LKRSQREIRIFERGAKTMTAPKIETKEEVRRRLLELLTDGWELPCHLGREDVKVILQELLGEEKIQISKNRQGEAVFVIVKS